MNNESQPVRSAASCPICGKLRVEKYKPFCSARCADIDLHRWFSGTYAIPTEEDPENPAPNNAEDV